MNLEARSQRRYTPDELFDLLRAGIEAHYEAERQKIEEQYQTEVGALDFVYRLMNGGADPPTYPEPETQ